MPGAFVRDSRKEESMAATIKDIRKRTGLSLATISKYLNGGNVLPENRAKIEEAISGLHYEVNELARGLVMNRTRTIGVIVFNIDNMFNGALLRHIGNELRRSGYGMLICDSGDSRELEQQNVRFLISKKVDGILIIPVSEDAAFLQPAKDAEIPVVVVDREIENCGCDYVSIDNAGAVHLAVEQLVLQNHRRIAYVGSEEADTGRKRLEGFLSSCAEYGIPVPPEYLKKGTLSIEYGYAAFRELMDLPEPPTAVLLGNYELTLGAVMAANETGKRCPEDVSIFGFDDLILDHVVRPRICRVAQPMEQMGKLAAQLLLERITGEEKKEYRKYILDVSVISGDSVRTI